MELIIRAGRKIPEIFNENELLLNFQVEVTMGKENVAHFEHPQFSICIVLIKLI